jgi:hypothetical protein
VETVDKHADDAEEEWGCREKIGHVSAVSQATDNAGEEVGNCADDISLE